jgi:kanamycin kinase
MKRTLLNGLPDGVPAEFVQFAAGASVFDSSCSPDARVWFIDRDRGYYLKKYHAGALAREAEMTAYFHRKGFGTEVLAYRTDEFDWMLTARVPGEDATYATYLDDPKRLCDLLATRLRALHEVDFSDCPVTDRTGEFLRLAEENYQNGGFDPAHFPDCFTFGSREEAWSVLTAGKAGLKRDVLIHGDYCLPNIMLDGWRFSAFIDLGFAGVGDRHQDLFWGTWSLWFNLKTDAYRDRFYDAYGRDKVDTDLIRTVAAAEVLG